jgi:flavin reductase (DIM6/NTAB) family NADH-FMN oxidoreductase RutF
MNDSPGARVRRFVDVPVDKRAWSPSPLLGQIVLVTTVDTAGTVDVAPKSWVTMVSFSGPLLGFGCNTSHRTHQNIEATGEFVVNVPDASLAERAWSMITATDRLAHAALTPGPARTVAAPTLEQCPAHLECRHERTLRLAGDEVFIIGTITAAAMDEACRAPADPADRYAALNPFFFLENGWYATAGPARRASRG